MLPVEMQVVSSLEPARTCTVNALPGNKGAKILNCF